MAWMPAGLASSSISNTKGTCHETHPPCVSTPHTPSPWQHDAHSLCGSRLHPTCASINTLYVSARLLGYLQHQRHLRFRGGLAFKAHRLCVSLNQRHLPGRNRGGGTHFTLTTAHDLFQRPCSKTNKASVGVQHQGHLPLQEAHAVPRRARI